MEEEDNRTLKEKLKEETRKVGESTLYKIIRSELSLKLMWIICYLCISGILNNKLKINNVCLIVLFNNHLGIFVFMVANNILAYLKYEVVTQVRDTTEFPSHFPVITICNLNYFQTNESKYFMKDVNNYMKISINKETNWYLTRKYIELAKSIVIENGLNQSEIQKMGYTINQMVLTCYFNQKLCDLESDFIWFLHPNYG